MGSHMARKAKTPKFNLFNDSPNCFGSHQNHDGEFTDYFTNPNAKLSVEVGCGRAELIYDLAKNHPDQNFVGVDRKSDRMSATTKLVQAEKMTNLAFIQMDSQALAEYFDSGSLDVIWITFPDPYPRDRQEKHRLVNQNFINIYKTLLKPDGLVRFKTDDINLFNYFLEEVLPKLKDVKINCQTNDLHASKLDDEYKILTTYEKKWIKQGLKINFIELSFN